MTTKLLVSWWARLKCAVGVHDRYEHQLIYQDPVFRTLKITETRVDCGVCEWGRLKDKEWATLPERREGESFGDWMTREESSPKVQCTWGSTK